MALGFYNPLQRLLDVRPDQTMGRPMPQPSGFDRGSLTSPAQPDNVSGYLDFYKPLQLLNVSGQPERTPEGGINRPSPVYNRPPPQETFQNPFAPTAPPPSSGIMLPEITFKSDLPQVKNFADVFGDNTLPTGKGPAASFMTNAAQYLRGNPTDPVGVKANPTTSTPPPDRDWETSAKFLT